MAKYTERLTVAEIEKRRSEPGLHADGNGLYLQVRGDSASWLLRYVSPITGRERYMGLGSIDTFPPQEARQRAIKARRQVYDGVDPIDARKHERAEARHQARKEIRFADAARQYIAQHRAGWKSAKAAKQWESTIEQYAVPAIGAMTVADIDTPDIRRVLDPIWPRIPETASRLRGRIETILDWAKVNGYREGDNPARWGGHLDHIYDSPATIKPPKKHNALHWKNIAEFMGELRQRRAASAPAVEFKVLTAVRTGEALGARAGEFDLDARVWTVPKERMKGERGRPATEKHCVPLSDRAFRILEARGIRSMKPGTLIFPLSDGALLKYIQVDMGHPEITDHGMRSTFKDWTMDNLRIPEIDMLGEMCLAHAVKGKTKASYFRSDMLERRREVMDAWAAFCEPPKSAEVIPFEKAS